MSDWADVARSRPGGQNDFPRLLSGEFPPAADPFVQRPETQAVVGDAPAPGETLVLTSAGATARRGPGPFAGTGRTQLAVAMAQGLASQGTQLAVWVSASGRDAVISGYAEALRGLGGSEPGENPESAAARFLDRLERTDLPWLVVLDDVAEQATMEGLWPRGGGRVLVTTDHPDAAAGAYQPRLAPVGAFTPREAASLLTGMLHGDPDQRTGWLDLAGDLEFLPAAMGLAGTFLSQTGMSCRAYRGYFADRLAHAPAGDDYPASAAAAFALCAELADLHAPGGLARRGLALLSMMSPHGVPAAVLTSPAARAFLTGEGPADTADARSLVAGLAGAGLVTLNPGSAARTVLIHPLVQAIARRSLTRGDYSQAVLTAADALAQTWSRPDLPPPVQQALRACAGAVREAGRALLWSPECHPVLLHAGRSLDAAGLAGPAFDYWREMLADSEQMLGAGHPQTLTIRGSFGDACATSGRLSDAVVVHEAALSTAEEALGADHYDTLAARASLARAYRSAGRDDDAIRLAEEAAHQCEQALGPRHPDTLAAQDDVARAYVEAGRPEQAVTALRRMLAERERGLDPGHPGVYTARSQLAAACQALGQHREAVVLLRRNLAEREASVAPGHPDILAAREQVAAACQAAGQSKEALALLKRNLADSERAGRDDLAIAARASLASAYREARKFKDALPLYERILADRERLQGGDHADTIGARIDLGAAYLAVRRFAYAVAQYERAAADCGRVFGPTDPMTRSAREHLAEAAAYARSVLGIDLRSAR